jgi:hypothetical protein
MQILIVAPAALKSLVEQAVSEVDPAPAGEAFTIHLSSSGAAPVTHFGCQPNVSGEVAAAIHAVASRSEFAGVSVFEASGPADHFPMIARSLQSLGLSIVEEP